MAAGAQVVVAAAQGVVVVPQDGRSGAGAGARPDWGRARVCPIRLSQVVGRSHP